MNCPERTWPVRIEMRKVPVSLNKTLREHWSARRRELDDWHKLVWAGTTLSQAAVLRAACEYNAATRTGYSKMRVKVAVYWPKRRLDPDNFVASLKPLLDALKILGFIHNDSPRWLELAEPVQFLAKRSERAPGTVVEIAPV